jgi:Glycerophosphoryl diester phosphodiesterase
MLGRDRSSECDIAAGFRNRVRWVTVLGMKRLLILLAAATLVQAHDPWVLGHRGARAARPENTMAAFRYAADVGVDVLELDMVVTSDDRIVISHDVTVNLEICRLPSGQPKPPVYIRDLTLAELQRFDCGATRNPAYPEQKTVPGERMPLLDEVFREFKDKTKLQFMIETKMAPEDSGRAVAPEHFARLVYEIIRRHGMQDRVILQSFDHRTLREMKKLDSRIRLCMLNPRKHLGDYVTPAKELGAHYQFINWSVIQPEDVKALHAAGIKVFSGTTDDPQVWKKLIAMGVDGIVTDNPAGLIQLMNR